MKPFSRNLLAAALAAAFVLALPAVAPPSAKTVLVTGIRFWTNEEYTRVAIDLGDEAPFEARTLPADPAKRLPARIFVDIAGSAIREEILRRPVEVRNGLLKVVRAGRFRRDVVRVVIDLERESRYRAFAMPGQPMIVIDIEGTAAARDNAPAAPPPALPEPAQADAAKGPPAPPEDPAAATAPTRLPAPAPSARKEAPRAASRIRVMLDPGHGGHDPGAIGPTGLREKDVVLAIGRLVREKLLRTGEFDVRMTRDTDTFIPLEERTAMANNAHADIFVSLHINASRDRQARGYSTYVLSRASDRQSLELAARENGVPVARLSGIKFILDDLSLRGRKNESMRLAKTVNDAIVRNVRSRYRGVHDLGLKQAPFYVLVGARMTAVLVESSFISNPEEESRLAAREHLDTIADSVVEAIRYYGSRSAVAARAGP